MTYHCNWVTLLIITVIDRLGLEVERERFDLTKVLERKSQGMFVHKGFGFPVALLNVPMVRVRGAWTPDVDFSALSRRLLEALVRKPARLTGHEVRLIRHSLSMTLEQFAHRFGVTHPAVIKWERSGNRPTVMAWAVEKDIRLEALRSALTVAPSAFLKAYQALEGRPAGKPTRVQLDVMQAV